ncbi:tetratricopeptide repeat protein [Mesorhizobium australicum]|uniref:tetratricopeptide repeat protein n=1 Tax=Mesorhizobium australicum TaxID=536018 RepID=UPI003334B56F
MKAKSRKYQPKTQMRTSENMLATANTSPDLGFFESVANAHTELKVSWKQRDYVRVGDAAATLLALIPDNQNALKLQLKAAIRRGDDTDLVATARAAAAIAAPDVQSAAHQLAAKRRWEDAATLLLALPENAEKTEQRETLSRRIAAQLAAAGLQAKNEGDEEKAARLWQLGLSLSPGDAKMKRRLRQLIHAAAVKAIEANFETDANTYIRNWHGVLALSPDHSTALKRLATAYEKGGHNEASLELWARLVRLTPENPSVVRRVLRLALLTNQELEALVLLASVGAAVPDDKIGEATRRAVFLQLREFLRTHNYLLAAHRFSVFKKSSLDLSKYDNIEERVFRGTVREYKRLMKEGSVKEATQLAELVLDIDSNNNFALANLAQYSFKVTNFEQAASYYDRLASVDGSSVKAWIGLARSHKKLGDLPAAVEAARRCLSIEPGNQIAAQIVTAFAPVA